MRFLDGQRIAQPYVVIVEKEHEQPDVVLRNFDLFVDAVAELARRRRARCRIAIHAHQSKLIDRLRLAVLEYLEVGDLEIGHRLALVRDQAAKYPRRLCRAGVPDVVHALMGIDAGLSLL